MILCADALALISVMGGVEQNPGPGVETENTLQVLYSGCDMNTVKHVWKLASWDRLHHLEKLENALQQTENPKSKNKRMEEQLRGVVAGCTAGRRDMELRQHRGTECLVLGD
jgi:hypothetical protein